LWAAVVFAESADHHQDDSQSHALYARSAYAHGYLHGYEDGFHNADMDIHMGRGERAVNKIKDYNECHAYRSEFGDGKSFRLGYQQGFQQGYLDGIRGHEFRAIAELRKVAIGLSTTSAPGFKERDFDNAFSQGYYSGRRLGLTSVSSEESEPVLQLCENSKPRSSKHPAEFCDAFRRGFSLGFSDAAADRDLRATETARK
jgi:hypothetical protein